MPTASEITKIYYSLPSNNETYDVTTQLVPAPMISVTMNTNYASEDSNIIVGYTYTINLNGQATAYRNNLPDEEQTINFTSTGESIHLIRKILSTSGGILRVKNGDGDDILVAKGGILKSLNFSDSNNHWVAAVPYTATLEFQEIEILGDTISCDSNVLQSASLSSEIVDINKFKLKEFEENISIDLGDDLYTSIRNIGINIPLGIENSNFRVQYTLSATGKHYYIYEDANITKLIPAWEQAKNFCQDRLFKQVGRLIGNILRTTTGNDPCQQDTMTLANSDSTNNTIGIMDTLGDHYKIFNETIQCSTSESDGSFSLTYSAIVKRITDISAGSLQLGQINTNHKIEKTINYSKESNRINRISINGTIEGLIEGGLVTNPSNGTFTLPQQGYLISQGSATQSKYDIAKNHLDLMLNNDDFKDDIKGALDISFDALGLTGSHDDCPDGTILYPEAAVFNLTHNYHEGNINYTIEYSSDKSCGRNLANIAVSVERPTKVYSTFVIPNPITNNNGYKIGTVLQDLGTYTAQRINISIQGRSDLNMQCCGTFSQFTNNSYGNLCADITLPTNFTLPDPDLYILTQKSKETNIIDGSYSINLGYILSPGCST